MKQCPEPPSVIPSTTLLLSSPLRSVLLIMTTSYSPVKLVAAAMLASSLFLLALQFQPTEAKRALLETEELVPGAVLVKEAASAALGLSNGAVGVKDSADPGGKRGGKVVVGVESAAEIEGSDPGGKRGGKVAVEGATQVESAAEIEGSDPGGKRGGKVVVEGATQVESAAEIEGSDPGGKRGGKRAFPVEGLTDAAAEVDEATPEWPCCRQYDTPPTAVESLN